MAHHNVRDNSPNNLQESVEGIPVPHSEEDIEVKKGFYILPTCRFSTLAQALLLLDLSSSVVLWLCGGNNNYLENSVQHFTIRDSVFDLAALAFVRGSILFFLYYWLECISLKQIDQPYDKDLASRKCVYHSVAIVLSVGSLAYSVTKGVLIYDVRSEAKHQLHPTYYALVISSIVFCFLEVIFALGSFTAMRRLKVLRVLLTPNDTETTKKKKVNLGRLATLAKEVSLLTCRLPK